MSSYEEYLRRLKEANDRERQRRKEKEEEKNNFSSSYGDRDIWPRDN